ncbi:phage holin family protein [Helicobacter himalayensis]|uniref:phage holin family protein n=1 Tax=Helicobacter himalayensis TaxID=1591088 RepID=UPI00082DCFC5|nr:phage holin family protein [Helicobacter himalayensis]
MEQLLIFFPNLTYYMELLPVSVVALLAGCMNYLGQEKGNRDLKLSLKIVATSAFLALITFSILSATDLPYLAQVGLSAAVGYFGIDNAIEIVQKLIALKSNKGEKK